MSGRGIRGTDPGLEHRSISARRVPHRIAIAFFLRLGLVAVIGADQVAAAPPEVARWQAVYDRTFVEHRALFDQMAEGGNVDANYYTFQYVLDATLCTFEATGDVAYLERALSWEETIVSKATILDRDGCRNWPASWKSPYADQPISYQLWDFQGTTELSRTARIVLRDPGLRQRYGPRATKILEFARNDIVDKHVDYRKGRDGFLGDADDRTRCINDKTVLLLTIVGDVAQVHADPKYALFARGLAAGLRNRFTRLGDGLIWDQGKKGGDHLPWDTAHANRIPRAVVDLHEAGIVFTRDDVQGLARLWTRTIWDGSVDDPRFANFIDGTNDKYKGRGPWGNGLVYSGWVALGRHDEESRRCAEAVLQAILSGKRNPSLDYNASAFGALELAGHLSLMAARSQKE